MEQNARGLSKSAVAVRDLPPFVDPEVEYVGVGKLRQSMTTKELSRLSRPLLVLGVNRRTPIAVMISYTQFLQMQEAVLWRFRDR